MWWLDVRFSADQSLPKYTITCRSRRGVIGCSPCSVTRTDHSWGGGRPGRSRPGEGRPPGGAGADADEKLLQLLGCVGPGAGRQDRAGLDAVRENLGDGPGEG